MAKPSSAIRQPGASEFDKEIRGEKTDGALPALGTSSTCLGKFV
jgi:hypothetical protein